MVESAARPGHVSACMLMYVQRRSWTQFGQCHPVCSIVVEVLLYVHRNRRFIKLGDGSIGRPPRLSHSSVLNSDCRITVIEPQN